MFKNLKNALEYQELYISKTGASQNGMIKNKFKYNLMKKTSNQ